MNYYENETLEREGVIQFNCKAQQVQKKEWRESQTS